MRVLKLVETGGVYVAENAVVVGDVRLAAGANVWYGAVLRGDMAPITVGENTNVQDNCVFHCDPGEDLVIGRNVTVGHMAVIHARKVGDGCLVGMNAVLLAGAEIGEHCLIAACALVLEGQKIPPRSIVAGVPGKVRGQVPDDFVAKAEDRALRYLATARRHAEGKVDPKHMKEYGAGPA